MQKLRKELATAIENEVYDVTEQGIYFPNQGVMAHGQYFDLDDAPALAAIMSGVWDAGPGSADAESIARENLHERTIAYGKAYLEVLQNVIQSPNH